MKTVHRFRRYVCLHLYPALAISIVLSGPGLAAPREAEARTAAEGQAPATAPASTQAPAADPALEALLARPLSPGGVAALARSPTDPRVQKRLADALGDANAWVRTTAARVVFVTGSKGQTPALVRALAKEADATAGAEELRALATFLGAAVDDQAIAAVKRLGVPVAMVMAEVAARRSAADLLRIIPALREAVSLQVPFSSALAIASVQHPESATEVARSIISPKERWSWDGYVLAMQEIAVPVDETALRDALASDDEMVRTVSVWHVVQAVIAGDGFSDAVLEAAAPHGVASGAGADALTFEAYGREMLSRVQGHEPVSADWAGLPKRGASGSFSLPAEAYMYLTKPEIAALGIVRDDKEAGGLKRIMRTGRKELKDTRARTTTMRTFQVFTPGLIADLMQTTGCRSPLDDRFVAGQIAYREDGRPKSIRIVEGGLTKECEQVGRLALTLTIAGPDQPVSAELEDQVLVLFDRNFLACADAPRVVPAMGRGSVYKPAAVQRRVRYTVPDAARRLHLTGVVRLLASVSTTGCVNYIETRRSLHPIYDLATIEAMKEWRYTPATVDGKPVDGHASVSFEVNDVR